VLPELSGDVLEVPLVESAGGVVVASPEAGGVADESGVDGIDDESAGGVVLGSVVVVSDAGAVGAVEFCFEQAAVNANAPKQSRRTLRFM
jgi:hypothetical protein